MIAVELQDNFLSELCRSHAPVSIFLVNGVKLQGRIDQYDQYAILLVSTTAQLVYKHAISSVLPSRSIAVKLGEKSTENL